MDTKARLQQMGRSASAAAIHAVLLSAAGTATAQTLQKTTVRHAAQRKCEWLRRWMGVDARGRCAGPPTKATAAPAR